jgi:hypothetical protein
MRLWTGMLTALVIVLGGSVAWGSQHDTRIQWGSRVSWVQAGGGKAVCCDENAELASTRGAFLPGRITTFALADTALYAFYLEEPRDLTALARALDEPEGPSQWEQRFGDGDLTALLHRPSSFERIEIEPNGTLTLLADDVLHPGMRVLAVVNGKGEILGSRLLWSDASPRLP